MNGDIYWFTLILGIAIGLCGWMIYWAGLPVIGGFVGACAGLSLGGLLGEQLGWDGNQAFILTLFSAALCGVLGVLLIRMVQYYFFFLIGALIGAPSALVLQQAPYLVDQPWMHGPLASIVLIVLGAWAGGSIFLWCRRYVVAIASAVAAARLIPYSLQMEANAILVSFLVFGLSMAVQTMLIRGYMPEDELKKLKKAKWTDEPPDPPPARGKKR